MARFTKRQVITGLSILYLTAATVVAAYALHQCNYYSLPITNIEAALTVALPPLAGVALEAVVSFQHELTAKGKLTNSRIFQAVNAAFLIYETVLASLAGTHIAPLGGLWCPLEDKWKSMYHLKDATHIRRIQDSFQCCGFNSPQDMAYPFADKTHKNTACMIRYERMDRCLEPWRGSERKVAIMLLAVPCAVFLWKLALFVAPGVDFEIPWLPSAIHLPSDNSEDQPNRPRGAIEYRDLGEAGEDDSLRDEVNRLNKDSNLATHIESGRVRPSPLIQERENHWGDR